MKLDDCGALLVGSSMASVIRRASRFSSLMIFSMVRTWTPHAFASAALLYLALISARNASRFLAASRIATTASGGIFVCGRSMPRGQFATADSRYASLHHRHLHFAHFSRTIFSTRITTMSPYVVRQAVRHSPVVARMHGRERFSMYSASVCSIGLPMHYAASRSVAALIPKASRYEPTCRADSTSPASWRSLSIRAQSFLPTLLTERTTAHTRSGFAVTLGRFRRR